MNKRRRWRAKARRRGYTGMVSPLSVATFPWWQRQPGDPDVARTEMLAAVRAMHARAQVWKS